MKISLSKVCLWILAFLGNYLFSAMFQLVSQEGLTIVTGKRKKAYGC